MQPCLKTLFCTLSIPGLWVGSAIAQPATGQSTGSQSSAAGIVNETINLDTDNKRIVEDNFKASTAVELNQSANRRGIRLSVGASVVADRIDLHLQNVTGQARFISITDELLEGIELERAEGTETSSP